MKKEVLKIGIGLLGIFLCKLVLIFGGILNNYKLAMYFTLGILGGYAIRTVDEKE